MIDHLQRRCTGTGTMPPEAGWTAGAGAPDARLSPEEVVPLLAALLSVPVPEASPLPESAAAEAATQEALVGWCWQRPRSNRCWRCGKTCTGPIRRRWNCWVCSWIRPPAPACCGADRRPEFHPPWAPRSHLTQLTLTRLARPHVEQMVLRVTGGKPLPPEVVQQIVAKTDGVPLFVEEWSRRSWSQASSERKQCRIR